MTTLKFTLLNSSEFDSSEKEFIPFENARKLKFGIAKEIGHYSIDFNQKVYFDKRKMKYLVNDLRENTTFDLNTITSQMPFKFVTLDRFHRFLYWLMHHNFLFTNSQFTNERLNVDFIISRGALKHLLCTPYVKYCPTNSWEIIASRFNGIIYVSAIDTDYDIKKNHYPSPRYYILQSYGYKFEQFVTSDVIDGKPDLMSATKQGEGFYIVLKNVFNNHSLLYNAEIDAVLPHSTPGPGNGDTQCYAELKTSKILISEMNKWCLIK